MRSTRVWLLAFLYFTIVISFYAISFWLPQILRSFSNASDLTIGVISAVPYVCAAMGMVATAAISDRSGERAGYVAIAALVGAAGFCAAAVLHDPVASFAGICVAALGLWSTMGPFWTLPSRFLAGPAAAGGIALINSVGNTGGFVGPYVMGYVRDHTGSFSAGMLVMGASLVGTAALAMVARRTE